MVACLARRLCTYVALLQFIACRGFLGPPIRKADVSKLESLKSRPYFSTDVFNQQLSDAASKEQPEGSDDTINHSERRLAQPYFSSAIFHQDHVHHIAKPRTNGHKTPETSTRPQSYFSSDAFKTPGMVTEATTLADFSSDAFKAPELPETPPSPTYADRRGRTTRQSTYFSGYTPSATSTTRSASSANGSSTTSETTFLSDVFKTIWDMEGISTTPAVRPRVKPRPRDTVVKEVVKEQQPEQASPQPVVEPKKHSTNIYHTRDVQKQWDPIAGQTFWGRERSEVEIAEHVLSALQSIDAADDLSPSLRVVTSEPPLVVIDDFLSPIDCEAIIRAADGAGLHRSTIGVDRVDDPKRTSSTTWLEERQCADPQRLLAERVSRISGLPTSHMENLQVVRYKPGEQFGIHTDHEDTFNSLPGRGRLCTCLIYLQEPSDGGETRFYELEVDVPPKRGTAVFWWNTIQRPGCVGYHPEMFLNCDTKMQHAGVPVIEGEKWICNRWVHPVDYGRGIRGYNRYVV